MPEPHTRPVLVGMNNPLSPDPAHALYPSPVNCTGWRIWRMLCDYAGVPIPARAYCRAFDRRNLISSPQWSKSEARRVAPDLWSSLEGRTVLVFGVETLGALRLPRPPEAELQAPEPTLLGGGPAAWAWAPHPSGRCHWYNDRRNRHKVGALLFGLFGLTPEALEFLPDLRGRQKED